MIPDYAFKVGIGIAVAAAGLVVLDTINPRLGTLYLIVVLLGVALSQRAGVTAFTSFLYEQTAGVSPVLHHQ